MSETEAERLFAGGMRALARGDTLSALSFFEKAGRADDKPAYHSYLALCIAKERGQFQLAVTVCEKATAREPHNPVHYLNLGRIYLLAGKKADAIRAFREGLSHERDQEIIEELDRLGTRKRPLLPFLGRSNPINKLLGLALKKFGWR
ncbi:MAG: tetratricopeptide repeat protein [Nitrospirae bacterium]|nr:tetratricopeptide repeat protein [Nitrospirota bacterium]